MRFESMELVRYGRYTGRRLVFPRHEVDFHLVVGRNEAGKSTLRQTFHDLLFGIPMDTPMAFLHAGTELELAGRLSGSRGELAFGRRRRRNGGLVDVQGEPLAPETLRAWLGEVNAAFHERMFALDHRRLERGGRAMLQASDDVDSVLFQAAAGVSALNGVLEALRQEAASLWAPRRSRDRAWYAAADRLADAEAALKAATLRPSAWLEAEREVRRLDGAFAQAEAEHLELVARVRELERLRRSAPLLAQIRQCEAVLQGEDLAAGADTATGGARPPGAAAGADVLTHATEIVELEQTRLRVADHPPAIEQAGVRIDLLWAQFCGVLRQLGRSVAPTAEAALDSLAAGLPARPLRREIEQLLQEGRDLEAHCEQTRRAAMERRTEAERLRAAIAALPAAALGPALRTALDAVTAAGEIESQCETAWRACERERAALRRQVHSLAQPGIAPPADIDAAVQWLINMEAWQAGALHEPIQRRQRLQADCEALRERLREAELQAGDAIVALEQFRRSRRAVSQEEVLAARRARDALWRELVDGKAPFPQQAERYAGLVQQADHLADLHLRGVDDAARLQALQHESERREAAVAALHSATLQASQALTDDEAQWWAQCERRRLPAMTPSAMQAWLAQRDAALASYERLTAAIAEAGSLQARHDALLLGLVQALASEGQAADPGIGLPAAREQARTLLRQAEQARARRDALAEQYARLEPVLPIVEQESQRAAAAYDAWRLRWHDALERAGLPAGAEPAYVEDALALLADADELAGRLREAMAQRDRMTSEWARFVQAAERLALRLGVTAFDSTAVGVHVRDWVSLLEAGRAAEQARAQARSRLAELGERLLQEGEGRSRAQIECELANVDVSALASQSDALSAQLEAAAAASNRLAVEREQARTALAAMAGGDDAARAEARRQEALADMADIAERYLRLHAETRLLERVMEVYRERRQGPLLARAGRLFSALTLGAHAGLVVDPDEALLHARRADGTLVRLEGLSDGTRDQLYLALRLAALELYLDHAAPMPFIADDLFINYDDRRALAGLRLLGEVSRRTQVIFLTHHEHMVELAREALDGAVHVIELPSEDTQATVA